MRLSEIERYDFGRLLGNQADDATTMLTKLLVSNTLLALSKLGTAGLTLEAYAYAVTDAMMQCIPINACALAISVADVPPVRSTAGWWPDGAELLVEDGGQLAGDPSFQVCDLSLGQRTSDKRTRAGFLGVQGIPPGLQQMDVVALAAEHISSMLNLLLDAERHRRAAAASTALELIAGIGETLTEEELFDIVTAIQLLPGAAACAVVVERPTRTGTTAVEVGTPTESEPQEMSNPIGRSGSITVRIWWVDGRQPSDSRFPEIAACLATSVDRIEHTAQLLDDMETDELTELGNRRRASRALMQTRARASREGLPYSLLMLDLDKFKSVNDRFGHAVGDAVLRSFAMNIASVVRTYDIAARWGGEEFLVICPATDELGAVTVAQRILKSTPNACASAFPVEFRQTVSIGTVTAHDPGVDPLQYVKLADLALYEAKSSGRDRYKTRRLSVVDTEYAALAGKMTKR